MESWSHVLRFLIDKLVGAFPAWILKRLYTPLQLDQHVEIDLVSVAPLGVSIGESPRIDLRLRVTNKSPYVDVQVDHVSIEIWDSQPFIGFENSQMETVRRQETKTILCRSFLNEIQRSRLREMKDKGREIQLSVEMSFNSPIGRINKAIRGISRFRTEFFG